MVLHCAYLIVLVPVCYGLFYSFLKMGLFEKVYLLFLFLGGGGGVEGRAHLGNNVFGCILCHVLFLRKFLKKEKLILGHCKVNSLQKNQLVSFG